MKSPEILKGKGFDWEEGARYAAQAIDSDGEVNWRAAFYADPGVMSCPRCQIYLWREGTLVRCPDCKFIWTVGGIRSKKCKKKSQ